MPIKIELRRYLVGSGRVEAHGAALRLAVAAASARKYSDAQLDDYRLGGGPRFRWRAPLRMHVRARFSHPAGDLAGTAGFGFWNYPLPIPEAPALRLPQAAWFFYAAPPSQMKLDLLAPGWGWKAATIDTGRPAALALIPFAPLAVPLMQLPLLYRALWPIIQRGVAVRETPVGAAMTQWHRYELEWGRRYVHFSVDDSPVLERAPAPRGPLCFVAWLDNQYMIVTPQGRFGWGLVATSGEQWLELDELVIEPL